MKAKFIYLLLLALGLGFSGFVFFEKKEDFSFSFREKQLDFKYRMYPDIRQIGIRGISEFDLAVFDTSCNVYFEKDKYVEIIRQDDKIDPHFGIAMGFGLDEAVDSFPHVCSKAVMQFRDFRWGGIQFSKSDTTNHTGVVNQYSEDFTLTILSFENDTIEGEFKGVLLNGAGAMTHMDEGHFRIGLYRK